MFCSLMGSHKTARCYSNQLSSARKSDGLDLFNDIVRWDPFITKSTFSEHPLTRFCYGKFGASVRVGWLSSESCWTIKSSEHCSKVPYKDQASTWHLKTNKFVCHQGYAIKLFTVIGWSLSIRGCSRTSHDLSTPTQIIRVPHFQRSVPPTHQPSTSSIFHGRHSVHESLRRRSQN